MKSGSLEKSEPQNLKLQGRDLGYKRRNQTLQQIIQQLMIRNLDLRAQRSLI